MKSHNSREVNIEPYGHLATKTGFHIAFNQSSSKTDCEAVSELSVSPGTAKQVKEKKKSDQIQLHPLLLVFFSIVELSQIQFEYFLHRVPTF